MKRRGRYTDRVAIYCHAPFNGIRRLKYQTSSTSADTCDDASCGDNLNLLFPAVWPFAEVKSRAVCLAVCLELFVRNYAKFTHRIAKYSACLRHHGHLIGSQRGNRLVYHQSTTENDSWGSRQPQ
jgi:hypothetical protein